METNIWIVLLVILVLHLNSSECNDCDREKIVEVTEGSNITLQIPAENCLQNILLSRKGRTNGQGIASANSNNSLTVSDPRYKGRTEIEWPRGGRGAIIKITNATISDGGGYFSLAFGLHNTTRFCHQVYVIDKPSKPEIKLIWPDSSAVKEGGYIRATCNSTSRTHPRNPDSNLTYKFTINNTESPELDHQTRVIVKNNEIMIAALTKEDDKMIITCTVWEDDRIHMNASGSFVLHVSENNVFSNASGSTRAGKGQQEEPLSDKLSTVSTGLTPPTVVSLVLLVISLIANIVL